MFIWALMRSPWGRVLRSIREDEDAARALGKNVLAFKMQSLVIGGVIGSIGGLWLSAQKQSAQTGEFATTLTFFAFLIIVLGGLGRVKGPIVGTLIFFFVIQFVDNVLQQATRNDKIPDWIVDTTNFGIVKNIVAGLALAALGDLPSAGNLRRQTGAGLRCPLTPPCPRAPPGCRRTTRSSWPKGSADSSVVCWPSTSNTSRSNATASRR